MNHGQDETRGSRLIPLLLTGTMLSALAAMPALAQETGPAAATVARAGSGVLDQERVIRAINVLGAQRLEPETVLSYTSLRTGQSYTREALDEALKDLYESELFADVQIRDDEGALTVTVEENPVINRIVLEGNRSLKDDKVYPEIRMAPRQIYTRSRVRADVARIIELYRRQGRFAAVVDPKLVKLDQNRVDIVYEISEGPKSKVRQINIIGNERFSDGNLRGEMATKQARWFRFFSSGTSYDPDRLAYDQQKLRQFYLTEGYADFRVVSAVAELTPDKQDFIITYVVEEGERYRFGDVSVTSEIRDLNSESLTSTLPVHDGDWYDAKTVEDTVERLTQTAGLFGYAFADVEPQFEPNREDRTMSINFRIANAPRVYVERIEVNGNTLTKDKVVRREFRLQEGDAFNTFQVRRSENRLNSLGFFQENLAIDQKPGSAPDRIVLEANVEESATGELQLSAGFSSLERFILAASITQRNFRGMAQQLNLSLNYSSYSKSAQIGFTEPYLFDKNIGLGFDIFRQDLSSFNGLSTRTTTYKQVRTGFQVRVGLPVTEYLSFSARYGLSFDDVTLDENLYFSDTDGDGIPDTCIAGRYLCEAIGSRVTSTLGYSLIYDGRDNRIRPTRGFSITASQDFAGLGGNVSYLRNRLAADKYWNFGSGFIFSLKGEAGYIKSFETAKSAGSDPVRLVDRFFLGEPQIRGFDIRGVGPRIINQPYLLDDSQHLIPDGSGDFQLGEAGENAYRDSLGGRAYYLGHIELEIPLGAGALDMGLRPSAFIDIGSVFGVREPTLANGGLSSTISTVRRCDTGTVDSNGIPIVDAITNSACPTGTTELSFTQSGGREVFLGDTSKPRVSIGFGVNWNSPFGPFRIDIAKALLSYEGDDTKLVTFNIGTQF